MKTLFCCMRADFMKIKNTAVLAAHLIIPVVMAVVFLLYYRVSAWDSFSKVQAFFQLMGMGYPFLIGVFCAILAEQELSAGNYQAMLAVADRRITFSSKLLLLLLSGAFSVVLASVIFGTGYYWGMKQQVVSYAYYWVAAGIMLGGNVFLYILHLFLALRWNKGVTIGLGIAESLLSAVLVTGLGDGIWIFVPAVWANRAAGYVMFGYSAVEGPDFDFGQAAVICGMITLAALIAYEIWACRWDGVCGHE